MSKHILFMVHGMGKYDKDWHKSIAARIATLYSSYSQLAGLPFSDYFEFESITYDSEFEALREQWKKSSNALGTAIKAAGISASLVGKLNQIAGAANRNSFLNTHVVDVLLYYFLRQVAGMVRESVRNQILTAIQKRGNVGSVRWSIIAHSLGTAVVHDALHELYSDRTVGGGARFTGVARPTVIAMIANVSRLLEGSGKFDVYRSKVHPGADSDAGCLFYLSARHEWDPFTQPKKFAPMADWPTPETRARQLFVECQIRDVADTNVHALDHYLNNPAVHGPLFNALHGVPMRNGLLTSDDIETAHSLFVSGLKKELLDKALKKLKSVRLGEEADWQSILKSWVTLLK